MVPTISILQVLAILVHHSLAGPLNLMLLGGGLWVAYTLATGACIVAIRASLW